MYTLGGITFYETKDPSIILVQEYYNHAIPKEEKDNAKLLGEDAEKQFFKKAYTEAISTIANGHKDRVVFLTNLGIVKEESVKYEEHWMRMLGNQGLHFNPSILKFKTVDLAAMIKRFDISCSDEAFMELMNSNEGRYLCMDVLSSLTDEQNRHLGLTTSLAKTLITTFKGSYAEPAIGNNNCRLYIKYAPAGDISTISMLNRYLHMYL